MTRKSLLESRLDRNKGRSVEERPDDIEKITYESEAADPEPDDVIENDPDDIVDSTSSINEESDKQKKNRFFRKKKQEADTETQPQVIEYEESIQQAQLMPEDEREAEERQKQHRDAKKVARLKTASKIITAILATACAYLIFLIYGLVMTSYSYDEAGNVVAQTYSVEDIRQKRSFENVIGYYQMCRDLYQDVLLTDYQFEAGQDSYATIGGRYTALLDTAETLYSQINGANVEAQYNQITDMMASWLYDYLRGYLQNIATYCSLNGQDETAGNNAIVYNTATYEYFSNITLNIITMGEGIQGIDLEDIRSWSPETYIDSTINGN